ncbi:glycosyltransferase [Bradyrhizobium ganzhouense]|uniref:glycosyltransferase n=1 Tax=Bradyrhizobium ganzhouense TaxID=1179767 RepID=UPI003CF7B3BA
MIPAFNHEKFVGDCLASALADPYPNKELIIIDDGSVDRTPDIIEAWAEMHRSVIRVDYLRRPNRGIAATLNELAARANGDFLRLGASDDCFMAGGLQAQVEYLLDHPDKLAVIGDCTVVDATGDRLHDSAMVDLYRVDKAAYASDSGIRRQIISRWAISGPSTMIRREALSEAGEWSEDLRIDDWSFFLRLAALDRLGFIDAKVGAYRIHDDNTSRTRNVARRIANLSDAIKTARRHLPLFGRSDQALLAAQSNLIAAKISFLERRPVSLVASMIRFMLLSARAHMHARIDRWGKRP